MSTPSLFFISISEKIREEVKKEVENIINAEESDDNSIQLDTVSLD